MTKRPVYGVYSLQGNRGKHEDWGDTSKNVGQLVHQPQQEIRLTRVQYSTNSDVKRNSQQPNHYIRNSQTNQKKMKYQDSKEISSNDQRR